MFGKIIIENGQKKIKPLTADVGAGLPVGTWCSFENDVAPNANWIRAGTTFDASAYPVLASYLGTNVVPQRYDHSRLTNPELITISTDSNNPTVMEYDGFLNVWTSMDGSVTITINGVTFPQFDYASTATDRRGNPTMFAFNKGDTIYYSGNGTFYVRYYTHPLFIKATSGLSENQQDSVINALNVSRSYSTEEILTGKTWIDGKPIYRKVVDIGNLPNATTKDVAHNISNFGQLVKVYGVWYEGTWYNPLPSAGTSSAGASITVNVNATYVRVQTGTNRSSSTGVVTIEYTKAS